MEDFEAKRKNLFDLLESEEKKLKGTILEQKSYAENENRKNSRKRRNSDSIVERLIGKESLFKKPDLPIQRCLKPRVLPDFRINPHKWTKYSLEDADISDRTNTCAAHAFLVEIKKRKEIADHELEEAVEAQAIEDQKIEEEKIVFNKTAILKRTIRKSDNELDDVETQTPKFKNTTIVMPEYVVGQKPTKEKKIRSDKKDTTKKKGYKELKLSHLMDNDDDDDDDSGGE